MDGILAEQKLFLENRGLEKKGARDEDERVKENGRRRRRRSRRRRRKEGRKEGRKCQFPCVLVSSKRISGKRKMTDRKSKQAASQVMPFYTVKIKNRAEEALRC
jgi:hypothetical protein